MLFIRRRQHESIILHTSDGPIKIKVLEIVRAHTTLIGVEAPATVSVVRQELEELAIAARKVLI